MTNKTTKRALFSSVVALFLCFAMLLGTTYAWFTDSVSSASNVITAGNLDVVLEYKTAWDDEWAPVEGDTLLFNDEALYEPGYTEIVFLRVSNAGSLALKYNLMFNLTDEVPATNVNGEQFKLSDYLEFGSYRMDEYNGEFNYADILFPNMFGTRENALKNAKMETLSEADPMLATNAPVLVGDKTAQVFALVLSMPTTVGNEANTMPGTEAPSFKFGVSLVATQMTAEGDSFGNNYDVEASLPAVMDNAADLAAALTANEKNIAVTLSADVDLPISSLGQMTGGSGEYKLGGEQTETIVIDLNGHKLNITTTYWSNLGAKNPNATIIIKDGTMTSSQPTGTWNSYDVTFSNCNYVFENVVFDKAVALANTGKSVTMTNVTINETHDYYALWICAEGQNVTIDGLTVNSNGRGIKIDEQYSNDAVAKVTLNVSNAKFNTAKKAAIMVKSAAGADIALNNVNIANTIDSVHAVWVDEDAAAYADLVTVTDGVKAVEGDIVLNNSDLDAAIQAGKTEIQLAAGTYVIPASAKGKTLTLVGLGDTVIDITTVSKLTYVNDSNITFKNLTIKSDAPGAGYDRGFAHAAKVSFENCVINGTLGLYSEAVFTDCEFNISGDHYNVWTWGAPVATFTGCTFNSDGKAMLLYGQANTKLTLTDCVFNDNGALTDKKAAVEIGNDYNKSYELIVNNTVVNGYEINDKGINTGSTLWGNKNSMPTDKLNVVVDGVDVY